MKSIITLLAFILSSYAQATNSPCYFAGAFVKCFPVTGVLLDNQKALRFGELTSNGANYLGFTAAASMSGDFTLALPANAGSSGQALTTNGTDTLSWVSYVDLSSTQASIAGVKTFTTQLIGHGTSTNDNAAAGYIGETIQCYQDLTATGVVTAQYVDGCTITLTAGDWTVDASAAWTPNGAAFSATDFELGIITASGNSNTGMTFGTNQQALAGAVATTFSAMSVSLPGVRVTSDGTNLTVFNTSSGTTTTGQILRAKLYISAFTVATPKMAAHMIATRVR